VDLFEQLRREHEFGIGTIAGVAAKFGVHRRVVRQALVNAVPAKHHYPERAKPKLGAFGAFVGGRQSFERYPASIKRSAVGSRARRPRMSLRS
jgi:hypothetical protein